VNLFGRRRGRGEHRRLVRLVRESPLCAVDPRVKLLISVLVAFAVMLPLDRLIVFWLAFMALMFPARLEREVFFQIRRIVALIVILFFIDWITVDLDLAFVITFRFMLVVSAFVIFFATTLPEEFRLALERFGVPHRYAFSLSLAFLSVSIMDEEWRAIREAQKSRGAWIEFSGWRKWREQLEAMTALGVPAVVLTVKRAWALTEAAHTRGFDSPNRRPYRQLRMMPVDWVLLIVSNGVIILLFTLR
jgi:energy-coupling factor transport system permease protein